MIKDCGRIAVFDSGMGGLDVAAALSRTLPNENLIYLGDNARVPYGTKSAEMVKSYTYEAAYRLLNHNLKALVIACNTASAAVDIDTLSAELKIPVFGMIQAGVLACQKAMSTKQNHSYEIVTLATPGTIRSGAYQSALNSKFPDAHQQAIACPIFVPLVEMGWETHPLSTEIIKAQLVGLSNSDALPQSNSKAPNLSLAINQNERIYLLGCTHYPMMRESIEQALHELHQSHDTLRSIPFHCIDGADSVSCLVKQDLQKLNLLRQSSKSGSHSVYLTDKLNGTHSTELALRFWHKRGGLGELNIQHAP